MSFLTEKDEHHSIKNILKKKSTTKLLLDKTYTSDTYQGESIVGPPEEKNTTFVFPDSPTLNIRGMILLSDLRLAVCSQDDSIIIYSRSDNGYIQDICQTGVHSQVWGVDHICEVTPGILVSCGQKSKSGSIKIWAIFPKAIFQLGYIETGDTYRLVPICEKSFLSVGFDGSLNIWETRTMKNIKWSEGHRNTIPGVLKISRDNVLLTCSNFNSKSKKHALKRWNLETLDEIKPPLINLTCTYGGSPMTELDNDLIAIGTKQMIYVVRYDEWCLARIIVPDEFIDMFVSSLYYFDNHLLCGCDKGELYIVDTFAMNNKIIENKQLHKRTVTCIISTEEEFFLSGGADGKIIQWQL